MNGRRSLRWGAGVALLTCALVVGACGDEDESASGGSSTAAAEAKSVPFENSPENNVPAEYPAPTPKPLTIGILSPTGASEVLKVMWGGAEREAKRLGGKTIVAHADLDPNRQISQFEQMINQKPDAILLTPIADPVAIAPLLKKAAQAKIPVVAPLEISPGQPAPVPGFGSQIWHQRDRLAYLQVKEAARQLPAGAEVGLITFALPVPLFKYTVERQRHWAEQFGLKVVGDAPAKTDTIPAGEQAATTLLTRHPNIKGIFGFLDEVAIGAALAARAAGKQDVKTFGLTGGSLGRGALDNGRLAATVFVDANDIGTKAVQAAYDLVEGKKIPPVVLGGNPVVITKDSLDKAPPVEGGGTS